MPKVKKEMILVELVTYSPYIIITRCKDADEAEEVVNTNSQWILLSPMQYEEFICTIHKAKV